MKFEYKPNTVEVMQWDGINKDKMIEFLGNQLIGSIEPKAPFCMGSTHAHIDIVKVGDCVVKDDAGRVFACTPEQLTFMFNRVEEAFESPNVA